MKNVIIAIAIVMILGGLGFFISKNRMTTTELTNLPTPTAAQPTKNVFCTPA